MADIAILIFEAVIWLVAKLLMLLGETIAWCWKRVFRKPAATGAQARGIPQGGASDLLSRHPPFGMTSLESG